MTLKDCIAVHGKIEREEKKKRCIRDVEIGWPGFGTGTALPGCVSFGPEFLVQGKLCLLLFTSMTRGADQP